MKTKHLHSQVNNNKIYQPQGGDLQLSYSIPSRPCFSDLMQCKAG